MKKILLIRLFAIAFFCMASLAIKSESTLCNISCKGLSGNKTLVNSPFVIQEQMSSAYPFEDLIIKI